MKELVKSKNITLNALVLSIALVINIKLNFGNITSKIVDIIILS